MRRALRLLNPRLDRERFARAMVAALERAGYEEPVYEPENFRIRSGTMVHYLRNLYSEAAALWPWQRRKLYDLHANGFASIQDQEPLSWSEVSKRIYPTVRDRYYLEAVRTQQNAACAEGKSPESFGLPHERLTDRLCVTLVVDHPTLVQLVTHADLERWGVDWQEARTLAQQNLEARPDEDPVEIKPGLYALGTGDGYDAARMLLDGTFRKLALEGAPIVLVPTKNLLLIADEANTGALDTAFALAESHIAGPHPISLLAWKRSWPNFEPLILDESHALYPAWRRNQTLEFLSLYEEQSPSLQDQVGEEFFVAAFSANEEANGTLSSYCVWSRSLSHVCCHARTSIVLFDPELGH